jgi:Pumilio-family RNA binding repeat
MPTINYFPTFSPEEEILANLTYASDWCKDQYGSRNIQNMLESGNEYLRNKIFDYLLLDLPELVYDKFGNYVIQKYIDIGSPQNQQTIYDFVKRELLFISLHSYGCRVVQKIVEFAHDKTQIQAEIMKEIEPHLMQIILNQNGNHIIQKILEVFNKENSISLAKLILNSVSYLELSSKNYPSIPSVAA